MTEQEASELFDQIDTDAEGMITLGEWLGRPHADQGPNSPVGNFMSADTDRSRAISREEFLRHNLRP
ncbi:hypothetical protein M5362_02900 [Streptomyces sp. Je 1-79]|uniref:hypothetical protein n=1 Tax=Streptomyces sp. Je 1-79 TaxID=2943847 RepID=UPI0021A70228|nr:hypothetical protein [Streptomyces sp. Je 1-79]MCT4352083.1 hypothetical protein [Streptomyces sp. Je 1-79]